MGFVGSLAATGVKLSGYCRDRRCHALDTEEPVQVWMGTGGGAGRGEGFCDMGMVRVFVFLFLIGW